MRGDRLVPGVLWTPAPDQEADASTAAARALVALGHGAAQHKRQDVVVSLARRLVRHHGIAAVAIDGPVHGDRRSDGAGDGRLAFLQFAQLWAADGDAMTDAMVADWQAVLDEVQGLPEVGPVPVGWWGVSMGTVVGLPVVGESGRFAAAVLGLMGATGPTRDRVVAAAAAVSCPVLFLVQLGDALFPQASALELFDLLATTDKRLHANPGAHGELPGEEIDASEAFLARHLLAGTVAPPGTGGS